MPETDAQIDATTLETAQRAADESGLRIERRFTTEGVHPFDEVEWQSRDAVIGNPEKPAFEQRDVEFPVSWSQNATNIVTQKYFRGPLGSPERERSVRQMIGRVAGTIAAWGREGDYFATDADADAFEAELTHILLHQKAAFNSPVWFNVGFEESPQCSACQPYRAMVSTPEGMVPIGELVSGEQIGREVYDSDGVTRIVAVKENGLKPVRRVRLRNGSFIEATPDHVVRASRERREAGEWRRVDELEVGMRMHLHPHRAKVAERTPVAAGAIDGNDFAELDGFDRDLVVSEDTQVARAEAALAGWLQADGFVGQYSEGSNRSLTIEFQVANEDELAWVNDNLDIVFGDVHRHIREADTQGTRVQRVRLYGEVLREFVENWELLARGTEIRVPARLWAASHEEICAYLRSIFQADGYVTTRRSPGSEQARIGFAVIGERWAEDVQLLLNSIGIYSRRTHKREPRPDRHDMHEVSISIGSERARFAELVGFVGADKRRRLSDSLGLRNPKRCPDLRYEEIVAIEELGVEEVYDIQTESGEYLSNNVAVHNCFILSVEDTMESILDWNTKEGKIFRGGSGSGINLSNIRGSVEQLSKGGLASGPVSFMRGADAWAGTIKSGGKTRRAAKMVVLDVDHPDIEDFIWCKAKEEDKAAALRDAGFDMSIDGDGFTSIQYQNANNSVRVSDEFMAAAEAGSEWELKARKDGSTTKTMPAQELLDQIADAAWRCADPGVQYDTTINRWHTCPESGRINASNPCSEYMHVDDSACNLASINLMKFRRPDGSFDTADFEHAVDTVFLAQEIVVGPSSYPTEEIGANARAFRQLGLGYANLGAYLMSNGMPYDSDEGRHIAAAITALMTGRGYRKSAEIAAAVGPYDEYGRNREPHNKVMRMHRDASYEIADGSSDPALLEAACRAWDEAVELGERHGYRNAQATVLAPTGTISFLMDCDTTGIEPDFSLVKYKELVGGGQMTIVNRSVDLALRTLGYSEPQIEQIEAYVGEKGTIIGAPELADEHLPVFDVAVGERAISHMGHIQMMSATQPFLSGAISKCVTGDTLVASDEGLVRIGSLRQGEPEDSFSPLSLGIASLDGQRDTDAFYYGGERDTLTVELRSGHRVTGTPNHRLLVAADGDLNWKRLDELEPGDAVATQYGDELWAKEPYALSGFFPSPSYVSQKRIRVPERMSADLAFFLGAYVAEGHVSRSVHAVRIANTDEGVISRLRELAEQLFGIDAAVRRPAGRCPSVELYSKTLCEFLDHLGCGDRASNKRIPDAVLRSPRDMVLAFLAGLSLDCYLPSSLPKWAICVDSGGLLDDLQAVLTNLGIVHSRITKHNAEYDKSFDEVYAHGPHAQRLASLIDFPEEHKRLRAAELQALEIKGSYADVVPGLDGGALYEAIPAGRPGHAGKGTGRQRFRHLVDRRTHEVSRASLERVATVPDVKLEDWLQTILDRNLHFSPISSIEESGPREVYDVSVPETHAFVANGIVNHNTVNLPESATTADIAEAYLEGWRGGLKALAIYRDGSKTAQALRTDAQEKSDEESPAADPVPVRRRMPAERQSITHKFSIAGQEGYITAGKYEDGSVGEIFLTDIGKEGSTLRGMMNAFATAVSIGLQYGVPLEVFVSKFSYMRFDPEGITKNQEIPFAKSMPDYIMRWLASRFILDPDIHEELGILTQEVRARKEAQQALFNPDTSGPSNGANGGNGSHGEGEVPQPGKTVAAAEAMTDTPPVIPAKLGGSLELGPACEQCGGMMQRTGSCYTCTSCGNNTGCG